MIKIYALELLLFVWVSVNAQHTDTLLKVTVTATRNLQKQLLTPFSAEAISSKKLESFSSRTVPEALMLVNGVFVQKTNHGGGSPFIRGLTGNQSLILVDGIRLNNSTFRYGPNQYLNTIDVFTIDKIEVAKGTGSVQYGTDAMGGVLQVLTQDPKFGTGKGCWRNKLLSKWMSGGMEKTIRGETEYSATRAAMTAGVTYRNFGDIMGGDTTGRQSPSGYKEFDWNAKLKWQPGKRSQLLLAHQNVHQYHVPVYHKVILEDFVLNEMHPQQRMLSYAKLHFESARSLFQYVELIASHQQTTEGRNSRKNGNQTLRKEKDRVNTFGFTAEIRSALRKHWTANSGVELYYDKVNSKREDITNGTTVSKRGLYPNNSKYGNYSIYSIHHISFNKFRADAGIRYNLFDIRITDTAAGKAHLNPSSFVYNAALLYNSGNQSVYVSFSSGYRAPNVDDMGTLGIVDFRYEIPAYSLAPEKSYNYELGYKMQAQKINAGVALFYMQLKNLVTRVRLQGQVINGYPVYIKQNTGSAFVRGAEAEINIELTNRLNFYTGAAYTYGHNKTADEPLRRIPPFNGKTRLQYQSKKLFTTAEVMYATKQNRLAQGDKDDNRIPAGGTPGWAIVNLYAGWQWKSITIHSGLQNISNKDYRTHGSGINGYGRSVFISVIAGF
jgi:outer membrane receptor protein involved in Fe transport